ncbi:MAG: hypothetical protein IH889_09450 [Planctomycetes bacterium]|nr:hypothetical protein [Planctomycetota bacterium]
MTTYGTWLRGDARGWIDNGTLMPPDPILQAVDRDRMKHPVFVFDLDHLLDVGRWIGDSLRERLHVHLWAMTVQIWHVHFIIAPTPREIQSIVKCAKDAVRWGLRARQPIWTTGYDKRFCFDQDSVYRRIAYVERHNLQLGRSARPWTFIEPPFSSPCSHVGPHAPGVFTGG